MNNNVSGNIRRAIFPGAFDPFTVGHEDIVLRALSLFDEVVIAIGVNSEKKGYFTADERKEQIQSVFRDFDKVKVETYQGLTVDFARQIGASHILRGIRTAADLDYERPIAQVNMQMSGIDTIFLLSRPEHLPVSSSIVRELLKYGADASSMLPEKIRDFVKPKK